MAELVTLSQRQEIVSNYKDWAKENKVNWNEGSPETTISNFLSFLNEQGLIDVPKLRINLQILEKQNA